VRLPIKALSVNKAYTGRRFKTQEASKYTRDVLLLLRPMSVPDGPLELSITWGFSSKGSDIDNCAKVFIDCLQKKYGFNDNRIYKLTLSKIIVAKGDEFITFELYSSVNL